MVKIEHRKKRDKKSHEKHEKFVGRRFFYFHPKGEIKVKRNK